MSFLLDVNVLIALVDGDHVSHDVAHDWFGRVGKTRWFTCPLTENGLVRIVSNPKYPNSVTSPALALKLLQQLKRLDGHGFWPDDISLADETWFASSRLLTSAQITDSYLLGLAVKHGGRLATLDRRLATGSVIGGEAARLLI